MNGYPPYPPQYVFIPPGQFPTSAPPAKSLMEMLQEAEANELAWKKIKKSLAEEEKKDEKKDDKKKKSDPVKFSFMEVFGLLSLGSIPLVLFQLWLLDMARTSLGTFLLNAATK